jgi:DNA-binding NtrC family response regulator
MLVITGSGPCAGEGETTVKPGRPTIALIDDEPLLRLPLAAGLDQASYNVVAAANATEGLFALDDPAIDLAVIDVKLTGRMNGVDVAREAMRRNPRLRVILISGAPPAADIGDLGPFLAKPFKVADLLLLVNQAIGDRHSPSV